MYNLDLSQINHHPALEDIVDVLCNKTQNVDKGFFRVEAAYFMAKMAAAMRATIVTKDRGDIPVNIYALALATSGYGKGHSVNIVENEFMKPFKTRFMEDTFPVIAEENLWVIANARALRNGTQQDEEFEKVETEFKRSGAYPFTFDSGTSPAVKQLRHKLLMANSGSINLQIDEIGSNLISTVEVLTLFLELYDQGMVKLKLVKNTADNTRGEELDGKTPTNMLLFGTPSKLLDGGQTEDEFYSFLETGYARRCIFGFGQHKTAKDVLTPAQIYQNLIKPSNNAVIQKWSVAFEKLADPAYMNHRMIVEDAVGIELLSYKIDCEQKAENLAEHEEIKKAELSHRYFKALKLAGTYAFVDQSAEIEMHHLHAAIKLVEESGEAFQTILNREKAYVKLAKYIASVGAEVTHADLHEALPFYGSGAGRRNEMMTLAIAWGYKRHTIIKKSFVDGIEFFKGETLKETDINQLQVSYSQNFAYDYLGEKVPFDKLHTLAQAPGYHWANHHFSKGHRAEENVIPGFNMIVIDVDGGIPIDTVHDLMSAYKFMTYTTKRHTADENRFRLILPMNYYLELDEDEYKEFMNNVMAWLPFKTDESANQRSKKWESYAAGDIKYNLEGDLLDILPFIPKTSRNEAYRDQIRKLESLDNLERWFAARIAQGNRNNQLIKYAYALVDSGMSYPEVTSRVLNFNKQLSNGLTEEELQATILQSVAKRYTQEA